MAEPQPLSLALTRIVVNDGVFISEAHLVNCLARLYGADNAHKRTIATLCDDWLDPSGRLLGLVRDRAVAQQAVHG